MENLCVIDPPFDDSIIMLVGAGASSYLGLPSLDDLLRQVRPPTGDNALWERVQRTRMAIEAVPDRFSTAVFEEMIFKLRNYLETVQMIRTDLTFKTELGGEPHDVTTGTCERKWKQALTLCYRLLVEEYGPKRIDVESSEFNTTIKLIDELTKINSKKLHIYTTNYDCSFQVISSNSKIITLLTHIDNTNGAFTERWYYAVPELANQNKPMVFIHRLHGCVAWFTDERRPFRTEEVFGAGTNFNIDNDDYLHKMCIKLVTSQSLGMNPAFFLAFEEFSNHLRKADTLLVWGHSFRDIEVLRLINNSFLQREKPLDIYYIDPFLTDYGAQTNIHRTLRDAPVKVSNDFIPKRIPWIPKDGHDKLIELTLQHIKNAEG